MIALTLVLLAVLVVLWRRRVRRSVLAGRDSHKPIYQVEPPRRRVGRGLREWEL